MSGAQRLVTVLALSLVGLGIAFELQPAPHPSPRPDGTAAPQRIIVLAPSHVEMVFALGAGQRVVGVGDYCFAPPEAKAKPRCGGTFNPNYEQMLALRPDLVVVQGKAEKVEAFCRRYGVRILHLTVEDLGMLYAAVRELGTVLGAQPEAEKLIARVRADLDAVAQRVAGRPRPKVFVCIGRQVGSLRSLYSTGGPTFLTEMLTIAGGQNVIADVATRYPTVSKEDLVARAPDVILEVHAGWQGDQASRAKLVADWAALASLPAVRNRRIHVLTDDYLLLPGPRIAQVAARFAEVLHPEAEGRQ